MNDITVSDIETLDAPWGKELKVSEVDYDGGVKLLRLRIRENKRFTDLDLDPGTAGHLARVFQAWVDRNG